MTTADASGCRAPTSICLPLGPSSARLAREFVRSVTGAAEDPVVALVVTELVTNAVVHAGRSPRLSVQLDGMSICLDVFDDGPGQPVVHPFDATTTSGRGLAMVDQLADAWGVIDRPDGKSVWARLTLGLAG